MKMIVCVAIGVLVDVPDNNSAAGVQTPTTPIDELAARLRRRASCHHNRTRPDFTMPGVSAWMAGAFQESADRN